MVLKGVAICAMLCHHLFTCVPENVDRTFTGFPLFFGKVGKCCVALFVLLSGYGMAVCFEKANASHADCFLHKCKSYVMMVVKRFVHFYLQYWPIFIIFVPIGVFVFHRTLYDAYGQHINIIKRFVFDFGGIQGFSSYNITWWFNKLILILYLLSPLYYFFIRKACIPTLLFFLLLLRFSGHISLNFYFVDTYGFAFALGMCLAIYGDSISSFIQKLPSWLSASIPLAILFLSILLRYRNWFQMGGVRADSFIALGLTLLILTFSSVSWVERPFAFLGKHSANMYMTHTFIYRYWFSTLIYSIKAPLLLFVVLLLICLAVSITLEWLKRALGIYHLQKWTDNKLSHL